MKNAGKRPPRAARQLRARVEPTVAAACAALEGIAPVALAQAWDNVGLLAGDFRAPVRRVLLCIDLGEALAEEAHALRAELVVAYHPPIFRPISRLVRPAPTAESALMAVVLRGTAVYALHTALDAAPGGTNDVLAGLAGLVDASPLEPEMLVRAGRFVGPVRLGDLARRLARRTAAPAPTLVGDPDTELHAALVGAGAAGSALLQPSLGPGVVAITGELRHHDALGVVRRGGSAVVLSHWSSERPVLASVAQRLASAVPGLDVHLSSRDHDPFRPVARRR